MLPAAVSVGMSLSKDQPAPVPVRLQPDLRHGTVHEQTASGGSLIVERAGRGEGVIKGMLSSLAA